MEFLTREAILEAQDIMIEEVPVPEWGGKVLVRSLDGIERDQVEESMLEIRGKNRRMNLANLRAKLVAAACVTETGQRLFNWTDVEVLGSKSAKALDRVFTVAQRLAGMTDKDVEELVGNLEIGQNGSSGSGLHSHSDTTPLPIVSDG